MTRMPRLESTTHVVLLLICIITVVAGTLSFTLLQLFLPLASASGSVPFFQRGPDSTNALSQANMSKSIPADLSNTTLNTYENPGFGLSIQYPSSWTGMQLRTDPFAQTNTSIVAIFEAPPENQTDPYRENLLISVQGPIEDAISLDEYTRNSLNAFSKMSGTIRVLESSPSILSGLPANKIIYSSILQDLNLKKMQIFTIVNDHTAYVSTFGAEESQFNKYIPQIVKMVNSIRINQDAIS